MAYRLRLRADWDWVPDGAVALMGQQQADNPGYAGTGAGMVGIAQTASDIDAEIVPGGDSPSNANFQTALNNAAATLYTRMTTAGAVPGFTSGTLAALVQGWSSGNP